MIPYGRQEITNDDIAEVEKVLRSDFLTQGPVITKFEKSVANYCGSSHAIAVNSATSALHIACLALNLGPGDWLWTSPNTFVASANCGLYCGANIDFVDIDPETYNISTSALSDKLIKAEKLGKLPKIVIPVHFGGHPCDMSKIFELSKKYGFKIIEDASHAIGASYENIKVGSCQHSDITIFSFHPVKIITTGEGGCLSTNNPDVNKKVLELRSHGVIRTKKLKRKYGNWYYSMNRLGYNYRMPDINASLGISQLKKIKKFIKKRKSIAKEYFYGFRNNKNIILPFIDNFCDHSFHLFPIQIKFKDLKLSKKTFFNLMLKRNINLQVHYIPIHLQKYYKGRFNFPKNFLPEAEKFYSNAVSLPIYYSLDKKKVYKILDHINSLTK